MSSCGNLKPELIKNWPVTPLVVDKKKLLAASNEMKKSWNIVNRTAKNVTMDTRKSEHVSMAEIDHKFVGARGSES